MSDTTSGVVREVEDAADAVTKPGRSLGKTAMGTIAVVGGGLGLAALGSAHLESEDRRPSFLDTTFGPAVGSGVRGIKNFAKSSEDNANIMGWGAFGMMAVIGLSLAPTIGKVGPMEFVKSLVSTTAIVAVTIVAGLSFATWAQRGFEGGIGGLFSAFKDTCADTVEMLGLDGVINFVAPQNWIESGQTTYKALFGVDAEQEFGTVTTGEGDAAVTVTNDARVVNIPEGEAIKSPATGRIIMASADGVEGDDRSVVVIESPNGVYTVLRGMEGITDDLVGTDVTTGTEIPGVTSSGSLHHQLLVTYEEMGDDGSEVKAALIDPRNMADRIANEPVERIRALERTASEAELGEVVPSEFFNEHILPITHEHGRPVHGFKEYQRGSGHCVTYSTEEDAALIARDDMTVMHVEGNTMYVRYGDGVPATFGVYRNVDGLDESLIGQSFEAGQKIEGTITGGEYDYSLVVQAPVNGAITGFVVDPLRFTADQMVDNPQMRQQAIEYTKDNVTATNDPQYFTHLNPLAAGLPVGEMQVTGYGIDGGALYVGIGSATEDGEALVSLVGGKVVGYDTISDAQAAADNIDGVAPGMGLLIAHSEEAGVYTQYTNLKSVDNSGGAGVAIEPGHELPAVTGDYTERRLIVADPRDGKPYFVDPAEFNDIERLVSDRDYRIEAVDAAKEALGNQAAYVSSIGEMDYEIPEIEVVQPEVTTPEVNDETVTMTTP